MNAAIEQGIKQSGAQLQESYRALTSLDQKWAAREWPDMPNDFVRKVRMHQVRYESAVFNQDLRLRSGTFLRENGATRLNGQPLMGRGKLP